MLHDIGNGAGNEAGAIDADTERIKHGLQLLLCLSDATVIEEMDNRIWMRLPGIMAGIRLIVLGWTYESAICAFPVYTFG